MADKQPEALRLYQFLLDRQTWLGPSRCRSRDEEAWDGYKDAADLLVSQHALIAELVGALEGLTEAVESMQNTFGFLRGEMPEDDDVCLHEKWAEEFLAERLAPSIAAIAKAKEAQQ